MITKVLKDYQSSRQDIVTVGVREDMEDLAQKISRFAPKHFPADGFITYQIALEQIDKGKQSVPYFRLVKIIAEKLLIKIFTTTKEE